MKPVVLLLPTDYILHELSYRNEIAPIVVREIIEVVVWSSIEVLQMNGRAFVHGSETLRFIDENDYLNEQLTEYSRTKFFNGRILPMTELLKLASIIKATALDSLDLWNIHENVLDRPPEIDWVGDVMMVVI
jgi:hypothetical protein